MNIENIKDTLKKAYELHEGKNFEEAEKLYKQILEIESNNFGAKCINRIRRNPRSNHLL